MEAIRTLKFKVLNPTRRKKEVLDELFSTYREMVEKCLDYAVKNNITSRTKLHRALYRRLREEYKKYPSHYIYTAITISLSIFKSFRKLKRKGKVKREAPTVSKDLSIHLDDYHLFKFLGGCVRLNTHKGHLILKLKLSEYHRKILSEKIKVKSAWIIRRGDEYFFNLVIKKEVEQFRAKGIMTVDVNEKSIDVFIVRPDELKYIHIDLSEAKHIHFRYSKKLEKIQKIRNPYERRMFLNKYSGRRRKKVEFLIHSATKYLSEVAKKENVRIVLEDLKNIRDRIKYGKKLNRRLHTWNFRKEQGFLEYKHLWNGGNVLYCDAYNTSRECPICGELNPNGRKMFKCRRCGFEANRHFVACLNMAKRYVKTLMWGVLPFPPKAPMKLSCKWLVAAMNGIVEGEGKQNRHLLSNITVSQNGKCIVGSPPLKNIRSAPINCPMGEFIAARDSFASSFGFT